MQHKQKITYELVKHIATLSINDSMSRSKELNLISINGNQPKLDIRTWLREKDKPEQLLNGITLSAEEASILKDALNSINSI